MKKLLGVACLALFGCATAPSRSTITTHPEAEAESPHETPRGGQEGYASWYGREQQGHRTANGERFDMYALTAAHRTLPMHTRVRVTNLRNGKQVVVRINDRGPYSRRRIIDLSYAAARLLDMIAAGVVPVRLELVEIIH